MVSDFFYPNVGGVESHIFYLSQELMALGHKVIVITHNYGTRSGVRYLKNGLKVYYLPEIVMFEQATFPSLYISFPLLRNILMREQIDIVHAHQGFSPLSHITVIHCKTMGISCCFTDHSLYRFADLTSILSNKILKYMLSDVDKVICVSNTSKENTVLRAVLNPQNVFVIPNAVVAKNFTPDFSRRDPKHITIIVLSRLVYRKGIDLLIAIIPKICQKYPSVKFRIAGDGQKKGELEQMREQHLLHDRVEFIGEVKQSQVREVLVTGHIFLNTSLTEAFCMAIVEAACCGLLVVSTRVGGVPEVLPKHMMILAKPVQSEVFAALSQAIELFQLQQINTDTFHEEVSEMYSWKDVARRTEIVYNSNTVGQNPPLIERLRRYYGCGFLAGKLLCLVFLLDYLWLQFLEIIFPESQIQIAPDFPSIEYREHRKKNK